MKYQAGRSAALPLMFIAIVTRLFCDLALIYPRAHNAAWLCPIIALLLYLPFALALRCAATSGNDSAWGNLETNLPRFLSVIILVLFALLLLMDASSMMDVAAGTAGFTIGDKAVITLELPLTILLAMLILLGADAAGHNARIGLYILGALLVILLLVQLPVYHTGWLAPMLGGGIPSILTGALRCAGHMALLSIAWMLAVPDRARLGTAVWGSAAALLAALLLACQQMLSPTFVGTELLRPARLEIILNNGRVALSLQFVVLLLWYGGLLHLLTAEAVAIAGIVHRIVPNVRTWIAALAEAIAIYLLSGSERIQAFYDKAAAGLYFPAIALLLLLAMTTAALPKGGDRSCGKSEKS